ncbi:hypothetical protein EDB44_11277 [Vibrio crassostreae]|nr:hypothetical protein [Vibrio crassostreae]TCT60456.1 hypothetical protein EDB44_11277 [Vibrio crassostreae]TCT82188.1 hypothetical protein EDB43_11277 [Vibrio crassostreae]
MSNDKATELNSANQKLSELINELQSLEREYDEAVQHSANYLGYDERIEQARDEKAQDAFDRVVSVKGKIERQVILVQELAANY